MSAKKTTLAGQIVASAWITVWSAYIFISNTEAVTVKDIIFSGVGIAACFSPVYFSIILDKIKDINLGGG